MLSADRMARAGSSIVHARRAENAHHGITDELLDDAPVRLDPASREPVVRAQQPVDVLGVEPLSEFGRPDDVAEQGGDDLALDQARRRTLLHSPDATRGFMGDVLGRSTLDRAAGMDGHVVRGRDDLAGAALLLVPGGRDRSRLCAQALFSEAVPASDRADSLRFHRSSIAIRPTLDRSVVTCSRVASNRHPKIAPNWKEPEMYASTLFLSGPPMIGCI